MFSKEHMSWIFKREHKILIELLIYAGWKIIKKNIEVNLLERDVQRFNVKHILRFIVNNLTGT